ncbi:MAG: hypothetical protein Q7T86_18595 [Hyphomicrobiaceae bacterium]|nr:hypothetical protein [Hyphomicrobiaceae bacterium]
MRILPKFFSSLMTIWTLCVVSILGGLATLWWLSERLREFAGHVLVAEAGGVALDGTYKLSLPVVFALAVVLALLVVVVAALSWMLLLAKPEVAELARERQMREDLLIYSRNAISRMIFRPDNGRPRTDIRRMSVQHIVEPDGTACVTRNYEVVCPVDAAHAFEIWIAADDEAEALVGFRPLGVKVRDVETNAQLDWIPTQETLRRKKLAIFIPETRPGDTRKIEVRYQWPRFLHRVIEKGSTEFWWEHKAATENSSAEVIYEWIFKPGFPQVAAKMFGVHGPTASLTPHQTAEGFCWRYEDLNALVDKRDYRISIEKSGV